MADEIKEQKKDVDTKKKSKKGKILGDPSAVLITN
jgi:hypothetical protein